MELKFVKHLVKHIVDNKDMPKVQVERELSPILEIFIEDIFNKLAEVGKVEKGKYKFIASEFPLSNNEDNKRSVNIDWLLLNKTKNILYFVELKTDSTSFKLEQYLYYKDIIDSKIPPIELYKFLDTLDNKKYKNYKKILDDRNIKDDFANAKQIKLIYIAPKKLKQFNPRRKEEGQEAIKKINFITFEDLDNHKEIKNEFAEIYKAITPIIKKLDEN